jgi:hypothetical protein
LKQHPLAQDFRFRPLSEEELERLTMDIEKNGLHEKIVILEGMVLDGWTRYQALKRIGRGFKGAQFSIYDSRSGDPKMFVLARNALRRHLSEGERGAYAKMYYDLMPGAKRGRPPTLESVRGSEENNRSINDDVDVISKDSEHTALRGVPARETAPRAEEKSSQHCDGLRRPDKERKAKAAAATGSSVKALEQFARLEKLDPELAAEVKAGSKTINAALKEAVEKTIKKLPRRHLVRELEPTITAQEIFAMLKDDISTIDIRWPGLGRATFTTDAVIDPKKEVIIPTLPQLLSYAEKKKLDLDRSAKQWGTWDEAGWLDGNGKPILNWKSTLLHFSNCFYGEFATLKPPSHRAPPAPQGRSTVKTPEQHDRAAAALERSKRASEAREDGQWNRR